MSTNQIYFEFFRLDKLAMSHRLSHKFMVFTKTCRTQTKPQTKSVPQINFSIISYILIFFSDKTNHNEIYDKFAFLNKMNGLI
jgi:hypothetical protein